MDRTETDKLCAIRDQIATLIGSNRFQTWFATPTDFRLDGERLDITVSSPFAGSWINTNFLPQIVEATRRVVGGDPRVSVRISETCAAVATSPVAAVDGDELDGVPAPAAWPAEPVPRRMREPVRLRGELDSYVVGPANELAFSVICAIAREPGRTFKHLVLHGGCGLGKTHLLQGICNAVNRNHPELQWRYISGEEFTNEFVYAVKTNRVDNFRARFRHVDLLVIDDIHFLAFKKGTQEEFLHTFNAIDACGKTVILSSDRHPRAIATLSEPLVNRLIAATVVEIHPPDLGTRREILRRRAAAMLVALPDEALDFLAQRITRNVRELEGALYKLAALASLTKAPIGLDLARKVAEDYAVATKAPEPADIERLCAAHFGVTVEALRSPSRDRTVTLARSLASYLLRKHTRMSFPEIGRYLGNKQHSTVLMAVRRIEDSLKEKALLGWKTNGGFREVAAQKLLDDLEERLARGREP